MCSLVGPQPGSLGARRAVFRDSRLESAMGTYVICMFYQCSGVTGTPPPLTVSRTTRTYNRALLVSARFRSSSSGVVRDRVASERPVTDSVLWSFGTRAGLYVGERQADPPTGCSVAMISCVISCSVCSHLSAVTEYGVMCEKQFAVRQCYLMAQLFVKTGWWR